MSEIKWRVYEPDHPALRESEQTVVYVFVDRPERIDQGRDGQFSGFCSREEFADLKRRLEGETDADVLAEIEGAFQDDGGN